MQYLENISMHSGKDVAELSKMSQQQLVDDVILPLWLKPSGQNTRGWRIPDSFMEFMARFGKYCYDKDPATGAVLYELALHRISRGAVLHRHRPVNIDEFLPVRYVIYSTGRDQPGLLSPRCWEFLREQMKYMLQYKETKEHATAILFGVLDNIDRNGTLLNGYILGIGSGIPDPRDFWAWAVKVALDKDWYPWMVECPAEDKGLVPIELVEKHFSRPKNWRNYLWYWSKRWPAMDKSAKQKFFEAIGISGWWQKHIIKKEIKRYADEMKS